MDKTSATRSGRSPLLARPGRTYERNRLAKSHRAARKTRHAPTTHGEGSMFTNDTLKGRTALITGGGSGIGLEIATMYARLGASVMLVGRNADRVEGAA